MDIRTYLKLRLAQLDLKPDDLNISRGIYYRILNGSRTRGRSVYFLAQSLEVRSDELMRVLEKGEVTDADIQSLLDTNPFLSEPPISQVVDALNLDQAAKILSKILEICPLTLEIVTQKGPLPTNILHYMFSAETRMGLDKDSLEKLLQIFLTGAKPDQSIQT